MTNFKKAALAAVMTATAFGASPALAGPTTAEASGTATVKIYSPLSIAAPTAADSVVDFGILVGTRGGALARGDNDFVIDANTIAPTAAELCTGATNWSCSGAPRRAQFVVSGSEDSAVNVWLDTSSITLTRSGGSSAVADDTVPLTLALSETSNSNGDDYADFILTGGTKTVYVGGTLEVSETDLDGVYTGGFTIYADYQ